MVVNARDAAKDPAACIFGNTVPLADYQKACRTKASNTKRFGDDSAVEYPLTAIEAPVIGDALGVRWIRRADDEDVKPTLGRHADGPAHAARAQQPAGADGPFDLYRDAQAAPLPPATDRTLPDAAGRPVVVGNIRMGFGHYRIAMAMASAARALGFTPYWFDLCSFGDSTCTKLVNEQNRLYSLGSRVSQKSKLVNDLFWEPLNSEGFRKLTYNTGDQKNAELMAPVYGGLPKDVPFIGTHAWTAQAALHAGLTNVVNAIPDNWPMALHLAEGSIHTVQTPNAYLGYKMLRGMDGDRCLKPMPAGSIVNVGHYIDHGLVAGIPDDCGARIDRARAGEPVRYLVCVGGAGAQQQFIGDIIRHIVPLVEAGQAALMINVGDHADVLKQLAYEIPQVAGATQHIDDFDCIPDLCAGPIQGVHAFCNQDIFAAVYSTNLLMRACDVLVTKPSELAFYPVPKMMIRRVGGHEAWGAVRAAEVGDGSYELATVAEACAFIDALQEDRTMLESMCCSILRANRQQVYDGAYRAVLLATGHQG